MEIVHIDTTGDYTRYEELTLQKEELEKEAEQYQIAYIKEFGELITKAFESKVDCIALKKEIAFYIAAKNSGKTVTAEQVSEYLKKHMTAYKQELARILEAKEQAKKATPISSFAEAQIKTIYRRLAKMLHPDISPLTGNDPLLGELFQRVIIAYKCNDLKELQKLEVLIKKQLDDNGIGNFNVVIPDIAERIDELEKEIDAIVNSEPYTYKKLLRDADAVEKKKHELTAEIKEYTDYKTELSAKLKEIKEESKND